MKEYNRQIKSLSKKEKKTNRDSIVFLIDCSKKMFEANDDNEIAFENAIKCAIAAYQDKIISNESDLLGVCFYNTETSENLNDFKGVYMLNMLDNPDAHKIMKMEEILSKWKEEGEFSYGHFEGEFPMSDAFWSCSTMFSNWLEFL